MVPVIKGGLGIGVYILSPSLPLSLTHASYVVSRRKLSYSLGVPLSQVLDRLGTATYEHIIASCVCVHDTSIVLDLQYR